jgi:hypothetical protein
MTKAELKIYTALDSLTDAYDEEFIMGLWFGFTNEGVQNLSRSKKAYELGRTCTYALIVKNMFNKDPFLGLSGLKKDNFFFGNSPGESSQKKPTPFYVKSKLRLSFKNQAVADAIYGILIHSVNKIGTSYLTVDLRKVVEQCIIPFDQLLTRNYPTYTVTGKKSKLKERRKPKAIRQSPLLFKEESNLLHEITNPIFTDLYAIENDFVGQVATWGFSTVEERISKAISSRLDILQRFANRTKLRLQDIRKITDQPKKRKAGVLHEDILALANESPDMPNRLYTEILHIVEKHNLPRLVSVAYNLQSLSNEKARLYLLKKCMDVYKKIGIKELKKQPKDIEIDVETAELEFSKTQERLSKFDSKLSSLHSNVKGLSRSRISQLYGRRTQIDGILKNITETINLVKDIEKTNLANNAVEYYTGGKQSSFERYVEERLQNINELLSIEGKTLEVRQKNAHAENERVILAELVKLTKRTL